MLFIGSLFLASLSTGCLFKLGPDFEHPEEKLEQNWIDHRNAAFKPGDYREWWKLFKDPVLNRLVDRAYHQNLDLQQAAMRIMEARAQVGITKGNLFPQTQQLRTDLSYNQLSVHMPNVSVHSFTWWDSGFDTLWEIDTWGFFRRGIESAEAKANASLLDYDDVLVSLTADVAASYVQIRTFERRLQLANGNAEIQRRSLRIAESQFRNGIATELDVQQARALLHSTEALIAAMEMGIRQSKNALSVLLGLPPADLPRLLGENGKIPDVPNEVVVGIPADLIRRRPDIRRQEMAAAAQSALIGVARAELFPHFTLQGTIGAASSDVGASDLFIHGMVAKVGPRIVWPIFNYGRLKNNVRVQDARFQELLINYKNTMLRAQREVEDAMIGVLRTRDQATALGEGMNASRRAVDLSVAQYRNGLEDYTRVLNSQQLLVQQQDRFASSRGEVARNVIALYKALGGGWEIREGKDLVPPDIKRTMGERTDWGDLLNESGEAVEKAIIIP